MKNITMELLSAEEVKMYRTRVFVKTMEKPNFILHYIVAYSIVSIFLTLFFLFIGLIAYIK